MTTRDTAVSAANGADRGWHPEAVREQAREQRPDREAQVAPEPVDADRGPERPKPLRYNPSAPERE